MLNILFTLIDASQEGFIRPYSAIPWVESSESCESSRYASPLREFLPLGTSPVGEDVILKRREEIDAVGFLNISHPPCPCGTEEREEEEKDFEET